MEQLTEEELCRRLSDAIFNILGNSRRGKTCCPSEAARRVDTKGWRDLMTLTRDVARSLKKEGRLDISQRGQVVTTDEWTGPIRLRLPLKSASDSQQKVLKNDTKTLGSNIANQLSSPEVVSMSKDAVRAQTDISKSYSSRKEAEDKVVKTKSGNLIQQLLT